MSKVSGSCRTRRVWITLYLAPFDSRMYLETSPSQDMLCVIFELVCKEGLSVVCQLASPFILVNIGVGQEASFPGV
jgi:arsenate reductase-like glutaredoxin family protein